jgi:hypothetical protein
LVINEEEVETNNLKTIEYIIMYGSDIVGREKNWKGI